MDLNVLEIACPIARFLSPETALVLFVAIQQENGVIHRNTQLQYCRQRFCNITDLAKKMLLPRLYTIAAPILIRKKKSVPGRILR